MIFNKNNNFKLKKRKQYFNIINFDKNKSNNNTEKYLITDLDYLEYNGRENKNLSCLKINKFLSQSKKITFKFDNDVNTIKNIQRVKNTITEKLKNPFFLINNISELCKNFNTLVKLMNKNEFNKVLSKSYNIFKDLYKFLFGNNDLSHIKLLKQDYVYNLILNIEQGEKSNNINKPSTIKYKDKIINLIIKFNKYLYDEYKQIKKKQINKTYNFILTKNRKINKLNNSLLNSNDYTVKNNQRLFKIIDNSNYMSNKQLYSTGISVYNNIKDFEHNNGKFTEIQKDKLNAIKLNYKSLNKFINIF